MKRYYSTKNPKAGNTEQLFIFIADGKLLIGGLSDRLRGIISVFDWCLQNGKQFRISFTDPFRLEDFLRPNKYNWTIGTSELSFNKISAFPAIIYESAYTRELLLKLFHTSKKQVHVYTNMQTTKRYGELFNMLFKPTAVLEQAIMDHLRNIGGDYAAVAIRFIGILGDFEDTAGLPVLAEDEREALINRYLSVIPQIKEAQGSVHAIFLTTDSRTFNERAAIYDYIYTVPGDIVHSGMKSTNGDGYLKVFLDFYLMSKANKLYFITTGTHKEINGFSKYAAKVNNVPYEIITV